MKEKCSDILKNLVDKENIFFTDRGNSSILLALKLLKKLGKKKVFIQDQGGWITYEQFIKKLKFELHIIDTDAGILGINFLEKKIDSESILLINSMPGYFCVQENMKKIWDLCREKKCFLINDVSGSIGKQAAKYGDLIIGSFGRWKPINNEYGGFIGHDEKTYVGFFKENIEKVVDIDYKELVNKLENLDKRLKNLYKITKKIKEDLKEHDIIHKESKGINVVVRFSSPSEELNLIGYCKLNNYEYTQCPRYIRVIEPAISIEVKRLE